MANQSDYQEEGYQRRMDKSIRDARSPVKTRSRSRILALENSRSLNPLNCTTQNSSEGYNLKRKRNQQEPVSHTKKIKTKKAATILEEKQSALGQVNCMRQSSKLDTFQLIKEFKEQASRIKQTAIAIQGKLNFVSGQFHSISESVTLLKKSIKELKEQKSLEQYVTLENVARVLRQFESMIKSWNLEEQLIKELKEQKSQQEQSATLLEEKLKSALRQVDYRIEILKLYIKFVEKLKELQFQEQYSSVCQKILGEDSNRLVILDDIIDSNSEVLKHFEAVREVIQQGLRSVTNAVMMKDKNEHQKILEIIQTMIDNLGTKV